MRPDLNALRRQVFRGRIAFRILIGAVIILIGPIIIGMYFLIAPRTPTAPQNPIPPSSQRESQPNQAPSRPNLTPVRPAERFIFTVCNQSAVLATIAVMGRQTTASDWIVQGWAQTQPGGCGVVGTFAKGDFFAAATGPGGRRWGGQDLALCVTNQRFQRIHRPGYQCQPGEGWLQFKRFRIIDDQFIWTLPEILATRR
jgi:uncharacterized membrane protein